MNASQIHLALTHVPVILSFVGLAVVVIALIRQNDILTKTSFYIFLTAGLFSLPVYFSGEGAEENVEELPGVSEALIGKHEQFANISFTIILICAILSLAALLLYRYKQALKSVRYVVLLFAFGSALALAKTAHLGGQIRHSEIRTAFSSGSPNSEKENNETGQPNGRTEKNTGKENND